MAKYIKIKLPKDIDPKIIKEFLKARVVILKALSGIGFYSMIVRGKDIKLTK